MSIRSSSAKAILESDAASLWFHPDTKIVHHQIRRFVHGDEFRQVLDKGLEVFRRHGAKKWLSDDRGNGPLTQADGEWATNDWAPRVIAAGWKYWAVVLPKKVVGQMNMRRWIDFYAERGVTVDVFEMPDPAMRWLEGQR